MRTIALGAGAYKALRAEVRGTPQARHQHRIHAVLLVAGGLSCRAAARLLGASPRAVEYWVLRYRCNKNKGLFDSLPPGRPSRLAPAQLVELRVAVTSSSPDGGWTGAVVADFVSRRWGVKLGLRQAQRLLARARSYRAV